MNQKRYIRLKELRPNSSGQYLPSDDYMRNTDGSLAQRPYAWSTDSNGYLSTGNHPTGENFHVFIGGSFVESMYADPRTRFVSTVEQRLPPELNARCINAGYSGSTTLQLLNVVINKLIPTVGAGSKLYFFTPQGEVTGTSMPGSYWNESERYAPILPVRKNVAPLIAPGTSNTPALLRVLGSVCNEFGIDLALVVSPYRESSFSHDKVLRTIYRRDRRAYQRTLEQRRELDNHWRNAAAETGASLIDLKQTDVDEVSAYFYDELHFNERGHLHFGKELANIIASRSQGLA